jgi:2-amino-4-hydroxy-6-hydroxymethyldihydropteridine diphosphokinase
MLASVFIGLGSNLSKPTQQVLGAISAIKSLKKSTFKAASSLYQTPPMGPQNQPHYINAVVHINTTLKPFELLKALQNIEQLHNRTRDTGHWGARTLDLDILIFEGYTSNDPVLTLPHPGVHCRSFVLYPLCELNASLVIPNLGSIKQLIKQLGEPCPLIISPKSLEK